MPTLIVDMVMPMRKLLIVLLMATGPTALSHTAAHAQPKDVAIQPNPKQLAKLNALTPQSVAQGVTISGDSLDPVITLTTVNAYFSKGGFTDPVRSDNFLRAFISKRAHRVTFQLYQEVSYNFQYRQFTSVVFADAQGPQSAKLTEISHEVVTCAGGMCSYRDTLAFDLSEDLLREIAAQYKPGASPLWRFRFQSRIGMNWEDRISPAEAAGLLIAVDKQLEGSE